MPLLLELRPHQSPGLRDMVGAGVGTGLRPTLLGLRQVRLRRTVPPEHQRVALGVSKLGSQWWPCTGTLRWPCIYAEVQGREIQPVSSFVPGGVSL